MGDVVALNCEELKFLELLIETSKKTRELACQSSGVLYQPWVFGFDIEKMAAYDEIRIPDSDHVLRIHYRLNPEEDCEVLIHEESLLEAVGGLLDFKQSMKESYRR